ncbi:MAG: hypothetical protein J6W16_07750 [Methanobrevibacter sp.]|nr:hypothetical protein [Methanobrevibacter sp.]
MKFVAFSGSLSKANIKILVSSSKSLMNIPFFSTDIGYSIPVIVMHASDVAYSSSI